MNTTKIRGIIIRESFSGESDKFITILAKGIGKISVFCKGARNTKSKFLAGTSLFTYGDFVINESGKSNYLNSVDIIESFYSLRNDILVLAYANYFLEFTDKALPINFSEDRILILLLKALQNLLKHKSSELVARCFELKIVDYLGYFPAMDKCVSCGNPDVSYILPEGTLCNSCHLNTRGSVKISEPTIIAMEYIHENDATKLFNFTLNESFYKEFEKINKILISANLDFTCKSYNFIKTLS